MIRHRSAQFLPFCEKNLLKKEKAHTVAWAFAENGKTTV
jgi:hypothetical protein